MTGFGEADGTVGGVAVRVDVRTVNHRFFSPSIKLPSSFARWESDVRDVLRQRVARGHVTLTVRIDRDEDGRGTIDESRFAEAVEQLASLKARYGLAGEVDLATVLRMPDLFGGARNVSDEGSPAELMSLVESALGRLEAARRDEGARLAAILEERLALVVASLDRIGARAPERLMAHRDKLRAAVAELAQGVVLDEQRLALEVALLAERLDVAEELDRFRGHVVAFRGALGSHAGEPVGKRLGFLLQEMLREANTTGSKAADAAILHEVIGIKEELERLREQVENLE